MLAVQSLELLAGEKEEIPRMEQVTQLLPNDSKVVGSLYLTNYRISFRSSDAEFDSAIRDFDVPIASLKSLKKYKPSEGTKVKSYLKLIATDFKTFSFHFPLNSGGTKKLMVGIEKLVLPMHGLGHCFATVSKENWEPLMKVYDASWTSGLPAAEYDRVGITEFGEFRAADMNNRYQLSLYYPPTVLVPNSMSESQIEACSQLRENGQFPIITWRAPGGVFLFRAMSQVLDKELDADLLFIRAIALKCPNKALRILDVGSKRALAPYGRQYASYQPEYLDIPNHTQVEVAFNSIADCINTTRDIGLTGFGNDWIFILTKIMEQVSSISKIIDSGFSVLIQGNKKSLMHFALLTLIQIGSDPFYRTIEGLCRLLEKEWIQICFPFREHSMHRDKGSLPVFEATMHCIWMLVQAHPAHFEYDERLLGFLLDHLFSGRFHNFTSASRRDTERLRTPGPHSDVAFSPNAVSIWGYIQCHAKDFIAPTFDPEFVPQNSFDLSGPLLSPGSSPSTSLNSSNNSSLTQSGNLHLKRSVMRVLSVEALAELPMIWRHRFLKNYFYHLVEAQKLSLSAKASATGTTHFALPPRKYKHVALANVPLKVLLLPGLTTLHFKNAGLVHLPIEIMSVPTLEDISFAGNPISHCSEDWLQIMGKRLTKLKSLDLDRTFIGTMSLSVHKFIPSLQRLTASYLERRYDKGLTILPGIPVMPGDSAFVELSLAGNGIVSLPPRFVNLIDLTHLSLAENKLTNIPLQLECLTKLVRLDISGNEINILVTPQGGFRMDTLTSLNLSSNGLETLPEHIGNLPALKQLNLAKNNLQDVPQRFFILFKNLEILDVSSNKLVTLPTNIGYMSKLIYLDLSGNQLVTIPDTILGMMSLKYLDLSYNKLPSLAVCFGRMKSLSTLKIAHNAMVVLPPHLGQLKDTLQNFEFQGNELTTPPLDIVRGGSKAVLDFLHDSLSGSKPIYRMKMMIVGEENVGKTTLVDQLTRRWKAASTDGIYEPISTLSTDGIMISTCSFRWKNEGDKKIFRLEDEFDVNISWWDFAGQELYYTTHQFFLSGRSLFVVVWNLEKPIEDSRVDFWLNSIQSKIASAGVVLVGTHMDGLKGPACEDVPEMLKQAKLRLRMLFPTLDIIAYATSAKTGEGLPELKDVIEKKIVTSKHMGELLPATYLLLERLVVDARYSNAVPIVNKHKFLEMASMCNIFGEKELFRASRLLHNLGALIYFEEDLVLSRYVILDPQWLAKLMYSLITTKHSFVTAGVIPHRVLGQIWREFPIAMYGFLLGLLEKFEVTYNLTGFIDATTIGTTGPTVLQLLPLDDRLDAQRRKRPKS